MIYVVLKLIWFFQQKHQLYGDEEEDENIEMEELTDLKNDLKTTSDKAQMTFPTLGRLQKTRPKAYRCGSFVATW